MSTRRKKNCSTWRMGIALRIDCIICRSIPEEVSEISRWSIPEEVRESRDQQTAYTEEGGSYARGIGSDAYEASRQSTGYTRSRGGGYSMDETLTQSEQGWDEASESQYGN